MTETLSDREREVIRLCAWGATMLDIATDLCITERTVEFHLDNVRSKLHARNSTHAAILAVKHGYISLTDVCQCDAYRPPMERASVTYGE